MTIKAKITIITDVSFCGVPSEQFVAEIGGKTEAFTSRFETDRWLREQATQMQVRELEQVAKGGAL